MERKIIIVGNPAPFHVGAHFAIAARSLGWSVTICDTARAYLANPLWRKVNWWLLGRRPAKLRAFSHDVIAECRAHGPDFLLTTGMAPLSAEAVGQIRAMSIRC